MNGNHDQWPDHSGHEEMTIEEIMLGKGDYYPGLVPLVYAYLGHIGCDADTMDTVDQVILDSSICPCFRHCGAVAMCRVRLTATISRWSFPTSMRLGLLLPACFALLLCCPCCLALSVLLCFANPVFSSPSAAVISLSRERAVSPQQQALRWPPFS